MTTSSSTQDQVVLQRLEFRCHVEILGVIFEPAAVTARESARQDPELGTRRLVGKIC